MKSPRPPVTFASYVDDDSATLVDEPTMRRPSRASLAESPKSPKAPAPAKAMNTTNARKLPPALPARPAAANAKAAVKASPKPGAKPMAAASAKAPTSAMPSKAAAKPAPLAANPNARSTAMLTPRTTGASWSPVPPPARAAMPFGPVAAVVAPPPPPPISVARTSLPPMRPAAVSAPAWPMPSMPSVATPDPQRKELPSFGPVAVDLSEARDEVAVIGARPRSSARALAWVGAAAAVFLGIFGAPAALDSAGSANTATVSAATAAPVVPASVVTASYANANANAPSLHKLTPTELFPPGSATSAAPPAHLVTMSAEEYQRQKARLGADLAQRNAPVLAAGVEAMGRGGFARRAPTVDELIRRERLRGDRD